MIDTNDIRRKFGDDYTADQRTFPWASICASPRTSPTGSGEGRCSKPAPAADRLLETVFSITANVALVLPPLVDTCELDGLPPHERQRLYLDGSHELFCLYFGDLAVTAGETEFHISPKGEK